MLKNALLISFAFIGTVVGAGFASGQEAMLYFSAFGTQGIWGAVLGSALMLIAGVTILQLGSFFQAKEHMEVLGSISSKVMGWILDIATIVTLFSIGFVMFAGAGANLNQQFGIPVWIGAVLMLAATIGFGMLDVDKVTGAIGALTPFLLVFVIFGCGWTLINAHPDWSALNAAAAQVDTSLPNWWIAALNYTGLNVMCVVSMALVIGGNHLDTRAAGLGGLFGGIGYLVMLMLLALALLVKIETVEGQDMPLLTLISDINPTMGLIMSLVIFGMIFATCLGMFFALGKRLARGREDKFRVIFISACLIGFVLSFVGFQQLVSTVYPILGYLGLLLIVVMTIAWVRGIPKLRKEGDRRRRALELTRKKMDPAERFTKNDERELEYITAKSNVDSEELSEALEEEVAQELLDDDESEFEEEDRENPSDVVYVSYTDPVSADEYRRNPDEPWNDHTVDDMIAAEEAEEAAAGPDNSLGGDKDDEEDEDEDTAEETGGSTAVSAKDDGSTKL
ncbi:YkvI family membrane protein [Corynebacterium sp. CQ3829_602738]